MALHSTFGCLLILSLMGAQADDTAPSLNTWSHYGASLAGDRYATPSDISPETVGNLVKAWEFRTGDVTPGKAYSGQPSKFRATPILVDGKLIFSTGFNRVIALEPAAGKQIWSFDPKVDFSRNYSEMYTSRGVAAWQRPSLGNQSTSCDTRIFLGTLDARLIAIDSATGLPCSGFGVGGEIDLSVGIDRYRVSDYSITSPPTVVRDLVIVGSSIGDNGATDLESGIVRAYSAESGNLIWTWDPIPRTSRHPGVNSWEDGHRTKSGGANIWSVMAADEERNIIYLPTTSPSPDFYGGKRLGDNAYANSIVALRASTGEFLWGYQTVRHDLWDSDLAAQPLLFDFTAKDGTNLPALAQATKMGFIFVLNRETGQPLHPVEDRAVPQTNVKGEVTAPTQKFPRLRLHTVDANPLRIWNFSETHKSVCQNLLEGLRYEGIFTPPSLQGTLLFPGNGGGTNWGSMAYNQSQKIGYLTVNRLPTIVKLIPRAEFRAARREGTLRDFPAQHTAQSGAPYGMARLDFYNPVNRLPCLEGPWASLVAVDLTEGKVLWENPAGTFPSVPETTAWGAYASGGPLVTAGGVVFLATPHDFMLRAYEGATGRLKWQTTLPAGVHATPMSYRFKAEDYVVVTAGDNRADGEGRGDFVIAYKLPAR